MEASWPSKRLAAGTNCKRSGAAAGFGAVQVRDHSAWSERDGRRQLAQSESEAKTLRQFTGLARCRLIRHSLEAFDAIESLT